MEKIIGIIASDQSLKDRITALFPEDVAAGNILIDILDSKRLEEQGRQLEARGAKAIIARSGGYRHTLGTVNIPVIHLEISAPDILYALKAAEKQGQSIGLFLSTAEYFELEQWRRFFEVPIELIQFDDHNEIRSLVEAAYRQNPKQVVVGGGIPCGIAKELGMAYAFIGASRESIHEVVAYARELVGRIFEEHYKSELIAKTLDGVHDAVLAINQQGEIILINESAKELLKVSEAEVIHKPLEIIFPELKCVLDCLKNGQPLTDQMVQIKRLVVTLNASILKVEGELIGALCSFQDITRLQSLEKKIRLQMNHKGLQAKYAFKDIISLSPTMQSVIQKAKRISETDETVILYGESGTGKEMLSQSIHQASHRKLEPFVAVNCAALAESLLESELFGYEEGAFTGARKGGKPGLFELAHGGTLFLDEINSMSLSIQAKVLRVIEEREVMRIGSDSVIPLDVRLIAATNGSLLELVNGNQFRADLYYRLSVLELSIPPLRERQEDILPLFKSFLADEKTFQSLTQENVEDLLAHPWQGNVRELKNVASRYQLFGELELKSAVVDLKSPFEEMKSPLEQVKSPVEQAFTIRPQEAENPLNDLNLKSIQRYVELSLIKVLEEQGYSRQKIADLLGISRASLWNKAGKKQE